jgi:hypothetical protein
MIVIYSGSVRFDIESRNVLIRRMGDDNGMVMIFV